MGESLVRGFLRLLAVATVASASLSQASKAETFLDRCFPDGNFLKTKIECRLSNQDGELSFTLSQSRTIMVRGTGRYGTMNKTFKVLKENITYEPPRLTDVGAMNESVQFMGTSSSFTGSYVATIDIPCNQTSYGTVGLVKKSDDDELPTEHSASCEVQ